MANKYQSVRGTRDLLPDLKLAFRAVENIAYKTSLLYGFREIETPIFEFSEVFHRSLGETSDAVNKETYTFTDRGGDAITLRPEGTAGIARAYVSEGLAQANPNKFYYYGPMFRYERPQRGRYRQFYQFGAEILGLEHPLADVECIDFGYNIIQQLGLWPSCRLEINTLGDSESRNNYRAALLNFLSPLKSQLSMDSQTRLEKNPLRILDSKDESDRILIKNAPLFSDFLNDDSKKFFSQVLEGLKQLEISYHVNPRLVRGLDYYCHTVFEFVTTDLGAQGALLAGGRYDGLVETLGGPATPGVGWASGVDRLVDLIEIKKTFSYPQQQAPISIIALGDRALGKAEQVASQLRRKNKRCEVLLTGNFKKKLEKANKIGTQMAILIFEQDNGSFEFKIKDFKSGEEKVVVESDLYKMD